MGKFGYPFDSIDFLYRVLRAYVGGRYSIDEEVLTAIMVSLILI